MPSIHLLMEKVLRYSHWYFFQLIFFSCVVIHCILIVKKMHKEIDKKTTTPMLCSCKRRAVLGGGNHNTLQVIFIPGWQYQCVKSGRSRQARQLEEWCWCKVWDQRLLFKWNQRNPHRKCLQGEGRSRLMIPVWRNRAQYLKTCFH